MQNPFPEPYSIRQVFYQELPEIVALVPDSVKEKSKNWAKDFYTAMCNHLSNLVLTGQASYRHINIFDDSGANNRIWQDQRVVKEWGDWLNVAYPIEVWVENNASFNSLISMFKQRRINLVSQRGWGKTQHIEEVKLDRKEDVEVILNLTDFDASGYFMHEDLTRRFKQIGLNVKVEHIGILPDQIPEERKMASTIKWKPTDPRRKKFQELFSDDPMVMNFQGYEIQALNPEEIRALVSQALEEAISKYDLEKREVGE